MSDLLTPVDDTNFGENEWFTCPGPDGEECGAELNVFWFMQDDHSRCNECGCEIQIFAQVRPYPEISGVGQLGVTESGNKIHIIRKGSDETVCGKDDITGPADGPIEDFSPDIADMCLTCIYIHEMRDYGEGTTDEERREAKRRFQSKLANF